MQQLWGMINVLQILVHMPLFNVRFPTNVYVIYAAFISLTNFDILPA